MSASPSPTPTQTPDTEKPEYNGHIWIITIATEPKTEKSEETVERIVERSEDREVVEYTKVTRKYAVMRIAVSVIGWWSETRVRDGQKIYDVCRLLCDYWDCYDCRDCVKGETIVFAGYGMWIVTEEVEGDDEKEARLQVKRRAREIVYDRVHKLVELCKKNNVRVEVLNLVI